MADRDRIAALSVAYERGRLWTGVRQAALAVPVALLLVLAGADGIWTAILAALLVVALVVTAWWRSSAAAGARLGLLGVVPPVLAVGFMGACGPYVTPEACGQVCTGMALAGGLLLGALAGTQAARAHGAPFFVGVASTALVAGCGCCVATGAGGAVGLALAGVIAAMPAYAIRRWAFAA